MLYCFKNFIDLSDEELKMIFDWRNHDSIRKWMYKPDLITYDSHLNFVDSLKNRSDRKYFLVSRMEIPIGVFSIVNYNGIKGEWGYYISPDFHSKGLSVEFYYEVLTYCFSTLNLVEIDGFALVSNLSANSLNDLFMFTKELIISKDDFKEYFFRNLSKETFDRKVKSNVKILRLLQLTNNLKL